MTGATYRTAGLALNSVPCVKQFHSGALMAKRRTGHVQNSCACGLSHQTLTAAAIDAASNTALPNRRPLRLVLPQASVCIHLYVLVRTASTTAAAAAAAGSGALSLSSLSTLRLAQQQTPPLPLRRALHLDALAVTGSCWQRCPQQLARSATVLWAPPPPL